MSENLSPEEVEALVGDEQEAAPQEAVELRDFSQPRRLSHAQQLAIGASVKAVLPSIEAELVRWLRDPSTLSLAGLGESNASGLFDGLEDPLTILTLDVNGSQGWAVWENEAALRSVLTALGSEIPEELELRALSPIEAGIVRDIMGLFASRIGELFDLAVRPMAFSQSVRDFLGQFSADSEDDTQRLFLHLDVEGPGGTSTLRLYLPNILPPSTAAKLQPAVALPKHLDEVPIQLSAELGTADVLLSDLMKIEPGDVIPLNSRVGKPIDIYIEGDKAGTAQWGSLSGCLALSIETLESKQTTPREGAPDHD